MMGSWEVMDHKGYVNGLTRGCQEGEFRRYTSLWTLPRLSRLPSSHEGRCCPPSHASAMMLWLPSGPTQWRHLTVDWNLQTKINWFMSLKLCTSSILSQWLSMEIFNSVLNAVPSLSFSFKESLSPIEGINSSCFI